MYKNITTLIALSGDSRLEYDQSTHNISSDITNENRAAANNK
jgi:hypothetical protein